VREIEADTAEIVEEEHHTEEKMETHKLVSAPKESTKRTLLNPKEETQVKKICGHDLKFTHLSKVYWPEDGITKRDMFNYYYQVAEYILPYLKRQAAIA
jgi:bifunctional non-homologous end joining protein LigD